ncbi:hypothetical protein [Amycolatopsis sp. H20-H5]|uniref:hypothetical protein n=1 Tax=Amycolatopsis sp. H20-H5 TaxID=3046309 RepID=UPI002DB7B9C4|nr:hypothetical protein [Amycolatopsis sp. H20-H5]MEC3975910.1 hypothetical protein [Amycolatopsis sp. H20-H5]
MTDYELPRNTSTRKRKRRRLLVIGVVAVLLAGGGVWWAVRASQDSAAEDRAAAAEQATHCAGLAGRSGPGYYLSRQQDDGQCVGWTTELDYAFGSADAATVSVVAKIVEENRKVAAQPGKPYVRVAVLMPMTAKPDSKLAAGPILHSLEGAYTAQVYTNSGPTEYGDPVPQIQLVLANVGDDQKSWPDVVARLGGLRDGEHPLVAVTGMGVSVAQTRDAAVELNSRWQLPSIGAVLTADDMTTRGAGTEPPGLFKVSPSNHDYAAALKNALKDRQGLGPAYLVRDRNNDSYVQSLGNALVDEFAEDKLNDHLSSFSGSTPPTTGSPGLFQGAVDAIGIENSGVVFYAGRDADLPSLVRSLKNRRGQSASKNLVVATGVTGLVVVDSAKEGKLGEPLTTQDLKAARVTILAASSTDPESWRAASNKPAHYDKFREVFTTGRAGFPEADLSDGYAIMHHDAVAAAAVAIHAAFGDKGGELPSSVDVRNRLASFRDAPIQGAAGEFYWTEQQPPNDLWPVGRPVPVLTFPTPAPQAVVYSTTCQKLGNPLSLEDYKIVPCTS